MASKGKQVGYNQSPQEKPIKVDKWDGAAVKNALDDTCKRVLTEVKGYQESHALMDGRLLICTISVGLAMYALVWDYLHPFPESRPVLIICVLSYFVMMAILTLYTTIKERGCFLVALEKDKAGIDPDNEWRVSSQLKRYDDMYAVYVSYKDGKTRETRTASFSKSVAVFFDVDGYLCNDLFEPEILKLYSSLSADRKDK